MCNSFMDDALKEAYTGIENGHGGPFGSVVVRDGVIIGRGHNCVIRDTDPTLHGEIMAIRDACRNVGSIDLSGAVLYTTAEPCPMCLGAVLWAGISKVYYGCSRVDTEAIGFRDSAFYKMMESGGGDFVSELDREQCLELFAAYTAIKDKKHY